MPVPTGRLGELRLISEFPPTEGLPAFTEFPPTEELPAFTEFPPTEELPKKPPTPLIPTRRLLHDG